MKVVKKPATKAREGINPFNGEKDDFQGEAGEQEGRIAALKNLKEFRELIDVHFGRLAHARRLSFLLPERLDRSRSGVLSRSTRDASLDTGQRHLEHQGRSGGMMPPAPSCP